MKTGLSNYSAIDQIKHAAGLSYAFQRFDCSRIVEISGPERRLAEDVAA
jgi:hypothetical protein